jgi:hypothetical protein
LGGIDPDAREESLDDDLALDDAVVGVLLSAEESVAVSFTTTERFFFGWLRTEVIDDEPESDELAVEKRLLEDSGDDEEPEE